jgi:hypothetical protein
MWAFKIDMRFVIVQACARESSISRESHAHRGPYRFAPRQATGLNFEFSIHITGFRPFAAMDLTIC